MTGSLGRISLKLEPPSSVVFYMSGKLWLFSNRSYPHGDLWYLTGLCMTNVPCLKLNIPVLQHC